MSIRSKLFTLALTGMALSMGTTPVQAQDDPKVRKDLSTVIALQGKPCGEIVKLRRLGENDYDVTCKSGHRYRVYVGANGRVIVEAKGQG